MAEPEFGPEHSGSKLKFLPPDSTRYGYRIGLLCGGWALTGQMRPAPVRALHTVCMAESALKLMGTPSSQTGCLPCGSLGSRLYGLAALDNPCV